MADASNQPTADAVRFLRQLAPDGLLTFQTFAEGGARARNLSRILHGKYEEHADTLTKLNERGAGVFVMVNAGDGKGRKRDNVQTVRAVFVDLDGAPLDNIKQSPLPPHLVCESSSGRYHAYWLVQGLALTEFTPVQKALASRFSGDPTVCDLARVMRVPGFMHRKADPFLSRLLEIRDAAPYAREQLLEVFEIDPVSENERRRVNGTTSLHLGERNSQLTSDAGFYRAKGWPKDRTLDKLKEVNQARCVPPLSDNEVCGIVESIYRYPLQTRHSTPHRIMDSQEYLQLPKGARALFHECERKAVLEGNGNISLTDEEMQHRGFNKDSLPKWRNILLKSGLLVRIRPYLAGRKGMPRQCALYALSHLGGDFTPK